MRKILIIGFVALLSLVLIYGFADAVVSGPCVSCHTMHNSQNNASMMYAGQTGPVEYLLRGNCLGCHGQGTGANIVSSIPQVRHSNATDLAGGNFGYITALKARDAADAGATSSTVGHNVIDFTGFTEATLTAPPGDENATGVTNANFTCAGQFGCHGNRLTAGSMAAIKGAHHANDAVLKFGTISEAGQGGTTALSYRFLLGVKGGEETNWMGIAPSNTVHNEYKGAIDRGTESTISSPGGGTISGLCAECHGTFHGTGVGDIGTAEPWLRHPTDIVMPVTGEYQYYNSSTGGGAAANYNIDAPVARVTITNSIVSTTTPGTNNSIVMCLSCHKAHATANADILRWNYEDISAGGGQSNTRCFICHTQKDT